MTIYTMIEPSAYFTCSCFPGTRPLIQEVYRKSQRKRVTSSGHSLGGSATQLRHDLPTGGYEAHNHTSISALHDRSFPNTIEKKRGFIKLEQTIRVDYSSVHVA